MPQNARFVKFVHLSFGHKLRRCRLCDVPCGEPIGEGTTMPEGGGFVVCFITLDMLSPGDIVI